MRQKFLIHKDNKKMELTIKEFANLDREIRGREIIKVDKEIFSFLCEETYEDKKLQSAIKKGKEDLIAELRTDNMFPIGSYAEIIAESIIGLYDSKENSTVEILFDDKEFLIIDTDTSETKNNVKETV